MLKRGKGGISVAVALCTLACGQGQPPVESEFQPYLDSFYQEAANRGIHLEDRNISIHFGETQAGVSAQCMINPARPGQGDEIIVNEADWNQHKINPYYRPELEIIMFHEFGHCLLGRDHEEGTMNVCDQGDGDSKWAPGVPVSIMKAECFIEPRVYEHMRTYYLDQLFMGNANMPRMVRRSATPTECGTSRSSAE